ncbi:MAG: hypothetical protein ABIQ86_08360 [Steroidobacteraceae bacterium]
MSRKKPDGFTLFVPDEQEPEKQMPAKLEVVDYNPARTRAKALGGGAYNPYERQIGGSSDTARIRKPRIDLRKLSQWIKTTKQVKARREEELCADKPPKLQR